MKPVLAYYGDDLTGSTDAMEALELRGVPTVLFTRIPTADVAGRFADRKVVGLAGTSRSETPGWMAENLPAVFSWLKQLRPELCHYKICSTFDSSPGIGSIGCAIDIGAEIFGQASVPLVVGAPELKRYTAFGNLFAVFRGENHRIDRHPVMMRHPVTPMAEADLRLHLALQTSKPIGLIDVVSLKHPIPDAEVDAIFDRFPVVLLDVLDEETKVAAGRHLWRRRDRSPFVVGSSGVEYALTSQDAGTPLAGHRRRFEAPGGVERIAVVSGSCSPTTERQIRHAMQHGFAGIGLDARRLAEGGAEAEIERAIAEGSAALRQGASPLLYTALGSEADLGSPAAGQRIGRALGRILAALASRHDLRRTVVAGGDTSSHAIRELGIEALECLMPLPGAPGSPLCRAHRAEPLAGVEIAFKGGQVGGDDYFVLVRDI